MSICTSNVTSGFIDLATYDELEKYMYGGPDATAYFVRETRKSTWFTQVPVVLTNCSGTPKFGSVFSVNISRAGDYLLQTWLRVCIPAVALDAQTAGDFDDLAWTQNLMHNLVEECCITFNDLVAARFDSNHLDFWTAFTVPASKRVGYDNMIGNITSLNMPDPTNPGQKSAATLNLPLPFFYSRDSGVALPTAALPYNEMRITFRLRPLNHLLMKINTTTGNIDCASQSDLTDKQADLTKVQVWANYAIVSNDERKRMACAPRDILIEQAQSSHHQSFLATAAQVKSQYDLRYSHAVKVLFFAAQNTTLCCNRSNYTTASPWNAASGFSHKHGSDPIIATSLIYENTARLSDMGSDYFACVNPYYHAVSIPAKTGYHSYSYSLHFDSLDPMGSTNYGKLTNVSICPEASQSAQDSLDDDQKYEFVCTAVNNNIIRISGGALGFPVL